MICRTIAGIFVLAAAMIAAQSSDFERARDAFQRAAAETGTARKQALLEESIRYVKTFEAYYALGGLQLGLKQFPQARESFREAMAVAKNEPAVAASRFKLGLASEGLGDTLEAISLLESSMELVPDETVAAELKRIRLEAAGKVYGAAAISKALTLSKSLGKTAKIDLSSVNFAFDSADLTVAGKKQCEELGKLLTKNDFPGYVFVFVGHTDVNGGEDYNKDLSSKRAETVKRYLVERYSIAYNRVRTEGRGKLEPLYGGPPSDDNDKLNRRVEVRLVAR